MTTVCKKCGATIHIGDWPICPHGSVYRHNAEVREKERTVLFHNPGTGEYRYPGRNDVPMGARLERLGYQRKELPSLAALKQHERTTGQSPEILHFDKGSDRHFG